MTSEWNPNDFINQTLGGSGGTTWRVPSGVYQGATWADLMGWLRAGLITADDVRAIVGEFQPPLGQAVIDTDIKQNLPEAAAGAVTSLEQGFPVIQGTDGNYYIINGTGGVVGGPYPNSTMATAARNTGRNVANRFVPGEIPQQVAGATGGVSVADAFPVIQLADGNWYVVDAATQTVAAGPYPTSSFATFIRDTSQLQSGGGAAAGGPTTTQTAEQQTLAMQDTGLPPVSVGQLNSAGYSPDAVATLYDAASRAGFTGDALHRAVATALAESGGNFGAENRSALGVQENSMGAWQINLDAHADKVPGATFEEKVQWLKDPYNAAQIAFQVSSGGSDWSPWSVWHQSAGAPAAGLYAQLQGNQVPAGAPGAPGGAPGSVIGRSIFDIGVGADAEKRTAEEQIRYRFETDPNYTEEMMNADLRALAAREAEAGKARQEQAIQAAIAQYQAQGIRVFRNQDGTLRLEDQNPQSPTFGQVRAAKYNPTTGQMDTSDPVSSGAVRARGYSRQIESTGQLPLTPQQAAISSYLGNTYGGSELAAQLMGREGRLSDPELSAVMGYPTATGNFAATSFANADKGPPVYGLGEALQVAAGPMGYTDVVNQRRAALGLVPMDLASLAGGGGVSAADVRANTIDWLTPGGEVTAPPQFLPSTPEQLQQLVDRSVAKWNLNVGGRNPLGITPQEGTELLKATGINGVIPAGMTAEQVSKAIGAAPGIVRNQQGQAVGAPTPYTVTIGENTQTKLATPDVIEGDPTQARRTLERASQNLSIEQTANGYYIVWPDGTRFGPYPDIQTAQQNMMKVSAQYHAQQQQVRRERADVLAGRITPKVQQPLGRRLPNGSMSIPATGGGGGGTSRPRPTPTPPPYTGPTTVPIYQSGGEQPNTLIGTKPLGTPQDPFPTLAPLAAANRRRLRPEEEYPLLYFDQGGVVPGMPGEPRLIMAHAGETVLPTHQSPQMNQLAALTAAKYNVPYVLAGVR